MLTAGDSFRLKADYYTHGCRELHHRVCCSGDLLRSASASTSATRRAPRPCRASSCRACTMPASPSPASAIPTPTPTLPSQIDGFGAHSFLPDHTHRAVRSACALLDREADARRSASLTSRKASSARQRGPGIAYPTNPYMPGYTLVDFFSSYKFDQGVELGLQRQQPVRRWSIRPPCRRRSRKALSCYGSNQPGCIDSGIGRTFFLTAKAQF